MLLLNFKAYIIQKSHNEYVIMIYVKAINVLKHLFEI